MDHQLLMLSMMKGVWTWIDPEPWRPRKTALMFVKEESGCWTLEKSTAHLGGNEKIFPLMLPVWKVRCLTFSRNYTKHPSFTRFTTTCSTSRLLWIRRWKEGSWPWTIGEKIKGIKNRIWEKADRVNISEKSKKLKEK